MKTFTQILNESKKTYEFKIGVAGERAGYSELRV